MEHLSEILAAWLKQSQDVWLCDCSAAGAKGLPPGVKIVRFVPDPGNRVRHSVATLTSGDIVIKADDDVMPAAGLADDFARNMEKIGPAILGIHGRTFHGRDYYRDTELFSAKHIGDKPKRVDFVGVVTCAPRAFLAMDLRRCDSQIEDLYWQMECYPKIPKYIIPTTHFENLPESRDAGRLCGDRPARLIRRQYFERWYIRNYKPADRLA
jgi:hypothetical protein